MRKIKLTKRIESCTVRVEANILHSLQLRTFKSVDIWADT